MTDMYAATLRRERRTAMAHANAARLTPRVTHDRVPPPRPVDAQADAALVAALDRALGWKVDR